MVSRNTSVLLAVAIIAIGAVAIIGVAYAYTASTQNTGNTSTSEYIVLDQESAASYTGSFNGSVEYDTVTTSDGDVVTTTYTINATQFTEIISAEQMGGSAVNAICLGTKTISVTGENNVGFKFSVANKTNNGMLADGNFYIGIDVGDGEQIRAFDKAVNATNYYATTSAGHHESVTNAANATAIDADTDEITVKIYLATISGNSQITPLNNVTFEFKAESVAAA